MVFVEEMLLPNRDDNDCIKQTHQHIAIELGSAREVISRVLKEFENKGYVHLVRGKIEVVKVTGLSEIMRSV